MTPDPTLRSDLMTYLTENASGGRRVILATPDYRPMCSGLIEVPNSRYGYMRCQNECEVANSRYCFECCQNYQADRNKSAGPKVLFHGDTTQILRAYRFLRRRANRVAA